MTTQKGKAVTSPERRETMRHADEVICTLISKRMPQDTEDPVALYRAAFQLAWSRKPETLGLVAFWNGCNEDPLPVIKNLDFSKLSGRETLCHTFARVMVAEILELEEPITIDFHAVRPPRREQRILRAA